MNTIKVMPFAVDANNGKEEGCDHNYDFIQILETINEPFTDALRENHHLRFVIIEDV
jgi:hypothetical protein